MSTESSNKIISFDLEAREELDLAMEESDGLEVGRRPAEEVGADRVDYGPAGRQPDFAAVLSFGPAAAQFLLLVSLVAIARQACDASCVASCIIPSCDRLACVACDLRRLYIVCLSIVTLFTSAPRQ